MTRAACLMVQGTASGVGKSLLAAAFCRLFAREGRRVAPFKAQNMSLNASVTSDGGEIGRAQAAQAEAAGVEPTVDMNPILLKPEDDRVSQLVVRGRAVGRVSFLEYRARQPALAPVVADSLARLRATHDLVVIEGAGSPAEINLRDADVVNMHVARLAAAPVLLVGDIDRGGVFAALVGTLALLDREDRERVAGLIINRLRGDSAVLAPALPELHARTGVPVLGVVPWIDERIVPAEDSLDLAETPAGPSSATLDLAVVRLPRIANFDDFEWLADEPGVRVRWVTSPVALAGADLVILPGSKSTMPDLAWLRERGLAEAVVARARGGGAVLGVCGGFQMLGDVLHDPDDVESRDGSMPGLGLLPVRTTFARVKTTRRVQARALARTGPFAGARDLVFEAYEIHAGVTHATADVIRPFALIARGGVSTDIPEGAGDALGTVTGTYLHGIFACGAVRRSLLAWLAEHAGRPVHPAWGENRPRGWRWDRLADIVAASLDMKAIGRLVGGAR
ncbi:MAG TPA: cobyric acid synthase [Solirubrobacteraceae bacterium]